MSNTDERTDSNNESDAWVEIPPEAALERLTVWATEVHIGRFERPPYNHPGELKADLRALVAENDRLRDALAFYADPTTYFGVAIFADPPTGGFDEDIEEVPWPDGGTNWKPGKRARAALNGSEAA